MDDHASAPVHGAERPVDVVIPLFNGGPWIEQALESVLAQTAALGEVLVVDDGSHDDGPERVRRMGARVRLTQSGRRRTARHAGLLATSCDRIAFLDQDDVWHPTHLARLAETLDSNPEAPAAAATLIPFRDGAPPIFELRRGEPEPVDPWTLWPFSCPLWTPSTVLFRRAPLAQAGGWALNTPTPDWEIYLRLAQIAPLVRTPSATCAYRRHPQAESSVLRRDGLAYLDVFAQGVEASFQHRQASESAMDARLARRRAAFQAFDALLRAVRNEDGASAQASAMDLDAHLAGENDAYLRHLSLLAVYLLCPGEDPEEHQRLGRSLLQRIARALPRGARRTQRAFVLLPNRRPFRWRRLTRHLLRGHWPSAWRLLEQRLETRGSQTLGIQQAPP